MSKKVRDKRKKSGPAENGTARPAEQKRQKDEKLDLWQQRLQRSDAGYQPELNKMDAREKLYDGTKDTLDPLVDGDKPNEKATHRRNIVFENIESKVSTVIPQPLVTPRRKKDEHLALIIENWLRSELNRQSFEAMNDMGERTVPIQGGVIWFAEWDGKFRSISAIGALKISLLHPKQLGPQPGVYTGVEDMDWVILKIATTKSAIRRKYGVDVTDEQEAEPQIRGTGAEDHNEDAVTQYVGFALNDEKGIDLFSWVGETVVEDLKNYQARRQPVCSRCGMVRPLHGQLISSDVVLSDDAGRSEEINQSIAGHRMAGFLAEQMETGSEDAEAFLGGVPFVHENPKPEVYDGGPCPWCGSEDWDEQEMEYEQVILPIRTALGNTIPGMHEGEDEDGNPCWVPTMIPFYRPDVYPIVIQKSVSVFGKLLGNSDVDAISDQQNTINRLEKKIIDRLLKAGTRVTLPEAPNLRLDPKDGEKWYLPNASAKQLIDVYEFKGDLQYELAYLAVVYEESRQILGITDSFQGRKDTTATSGTAKQFAAQQSAGRLESQRVMKEAAYAKLFELMFKYQLAYADEPWPVAYKNHMGETVYEEFNRYDFLEQDENGQWHYNDQFNFSCDTSSPLASDREAMWQETRMNLETGAFGDKTSTETLILFWAKMELLHYPGAGETKKYLEERLKREQAQIQQMQMMQMQQTAAPMAAQNMAPAVR